MISLNFSLSETGNQEKWTQISRICYYLRLEVGIDGEIGTNFCLKL